MPFDGSGNFLPLSPPTYPAVAGEVIYADRFNSNMQNVFDGLSQTITKDGQTTLTGNIPFNNFRATGMGIGTAAGQPLTFGQASASLSDLVLTSSIPGGDASTRAPTTQWVTDAIAGAAISMPSVTGNTGKILTNNGTLASWRSTNNNNLLDNAFARISQRGSSFSCTAGSSTKVCDRYYCGPTGATVTLNASASTGMAVSPFGMTFAGVASLTAVGFLQRQERVLTAQLASRTVIASVYVKHSGPSAINVQGIVLRANANDNFSGTTTELTGTSTSVPPNTETRVVVTGTLSASATTGIQVTWNLSGTMTSGTFAITGFKLEEGSVASDVEAIPLPVDMVRCQRFLPSFTNQYFGGVLNTIDANQGFVYLPFIVPARAVPTSITISALSTFSIYSAANVANTPDSITFSLGSLHGVWILVAKTGLYGAAGTAARFLASSNSSYLLCEAADL